MARKRILQVDNTVAIMNRLDTGIGIIGKFDEGRINLPETRKKGYESISPLE